MIGEVKNYAVSSLFNIFANVVYAVPRHQREYTWGKIQWEHLFDDILENAPGYFFGSIICISQGPPLDCKLEIVDGQQRLTTLSLLLSAIYQALKFREVDLDDDQKNDLTNLKWELVLKKSEQIRVVPQIQKNNLKDYRAVLSEIGVISPCDPPPNAGNRKIFHCFRYFKDRIEQMANEQDNNLSAIMDLLDKINQSSMVMIPVSSHSDAYILFESLNNRGMPLTAIDLIKNKLLGCLEKPEHGMIDHYYEEWNKLLGYLGDNYDIQERFFRHYYNAFRDELKSIYQVPVAKRSNLILIYEKLIDKDARGFLQKIMSAGRFYAKLHVPHPEHALRDLKKALKEVERIQGAPSYLLLLYLLARQEELCLNEKHLEQIVQLLVCFFVRRNLTDIPPTRDLTRLFMSIIEKLSGTTGEDTVATIRKQLIEVSTNDILFRDKLEGPIYKENEGVTRFVLSALEEKAMTEETWVDLWRKHNKKSVWTIEHIFPQGDKIPQSWVKMIAGGDETKAEEYQETYVHKLGNLTITVFNPALSNMSFKEKLNLTDGKGNFIGYRNKLNLNAYLVSCENWTLEKIENRTRELVNQAMELFK